MACLMLVSNKVKMIQSGSYFNTHKNENVNMHKGLILMQFTQLNGG